MKIQHGRYTLTNKESIEQALKAQREKIALQQSQLNLIRQWAKDQLAIHQPYTTGIDLSCHEPAQLSTALAGRIGKELWCARCSNPWPCKHIAQLRLLRGAASNQNPEDLQVIADAMNAIPAPARREGQIDVAL